MVPSREGGEEKKEKEEEEEGGKEGTRRRWTRCYLVPFRLVPAEIGCDAPRQKRPLIESHAADDRDSSAILAEDERQRRDRDEFVLAEIGEDEINIYIYICVYEFFWEDWRVIFGWKPEVMNFHGLGSYFL